MSEPYQVNINRTTFPDILEARLTVPLTATESMNINNRKQEYVKKQTCFIDVILDDDEDTLGSSRCSKCKQPINLFSNYCEHCGAKTKGRRLLRRKKVTHSEIESLNMTE